MKILIVSDTHGRNVNLKYVINKVKPIDLLIHLGDFDSNINHIESLVDCPVEAVCGNNDFYCDIEGEKVIDINGYKVFLSHGHTYGVSYDIDRIKEVGKQYGADIVMFGHTHRPHIDVTGDIWSINPGSISLPRQGDRKPTYVIMEIDKKGLAHFTLNHLKKAGKFIQ